VNIFPHPLAFQVPRTNFEVAILDDRDGPSGVALDPRSTCPPVRWDSRWRVPRRGGKKTGLPLSARKCVALLATARPERGPGVDRLVFELRSASMTFSVELDVSATQNVVRAYHLRQPLGKKRKRTNRRVLPAVLATSRVTPGGRWVVDKQVSEEGAKIRSVALRRTVDMLLTARPLSDVEAGALST
jgi:hypothetical protein